MGNVRLINKNYDIITKYQKQDWLYCDSFPKYQLWKNKKTQQIAQVYLLPKMPPVKDLNIYQFRSTQQDLVKAYYITKSSAQNFCSITQQVQLLIQHIPVKLYNINFLDIHEAFTILTTSLRAFHQIEINLGAVEPHQELIGVNKIGKVKIWLNKDGSVNEPMQFQKIYESNFQKDFAIARRVRKIYEIVEQRSINILLPPYFRNQFLQNKLKYESALEILKNYAAQHQINININLKSHLHTQPINKLSQASQHQYSHYNVENSPSRQQLHQNPVVIFNSSGSQRRHHSSPDNICMKSHMLNQSPNNLVQNQFVAKKITFSHISSQMSQDRSNGSNSPPESNYIQNYKGQQIGIYSNQKEQQINISKLLLPNVNHAMNQLHTDSSYYTNKQQGSIHRLTDQTQSSHKLGQQTTALSEINVIDKTNLPSSWDSKQYIIKQIQEHQQQRSENIFKSSKSLQKILQASIQFSDGKSLIDKFASVVSKQSISGKISEQNSSDIENSFIIQENIQISPYFTESTETYHQFISYKPSEENIEMEKIGMQSIQILKTDLKYEEDAVKKKDFYKSNSCQLEINLQNNPLEDLTIKNSRNDKSNKQNIVSTHHKHRQQLLNKRQDEPKKQKELDNFNKNGKISASREDAQREERSLIFQKLSDSQIQNYIRKKYLTKIKQKGNQGIDAKLSQTEKKSNGNQQRQQNYKEISSKYLQKNIKLSVQ